VVDCFDALRSDRPYRPAMTEEAALGILAERRGTMYDPVVVDTFIQVQLVDPHHMSLRVVDSAEPRRERQVTDEDERNDGGNAHDSKIADDHDEKERR
jgi:HD-GYP domain-containing protein (c-di-GMP phosphodiesterase class II)